MPVDPDLKRMMTDTVVIHPRTSEDEYGRASYGTSTTVNHARVEERLVKTVNVDGETVLGRGTVYLDDVYNVSPLDEVELPDGDRPRVINVQVHRDEDGDHHETVVYG